MDGKDINDIDNQFSQNEHSNLKFNNEMDFKF